MKTSEVMGWMNAASFAGRVGESRIGESRIVESLIGDSRIAHKMPHLPVGRRGLLGNASRSKPRA